LGPSLILYHDARVTFKSLLTWRRYCYVCGIVPESVILRL